MSNTLKLFQCILCSTFCCEKYKDYCKTCKKLCQHQGCTSTQAYIEGGNRGFCSKHGGYPLCQHQGCTTPQKYREGGKRGFCVKHGGSPLCQRQGCTTPQQYIEGGNRGFCIKHGGYPRCKCTTFSVKKVGLMCSYCDPILSEKKKKRMKTKENQIAKFLQKLGLKYERECSIKFDCFDTTGGTKSCRLDFVIYTEHCIIILEVDESQHRHGGYTMLCENRRTIAILGCQMFDAHCRKILLLRYNPDDFKILGEKQQVKQVNRLEMLRYMITEYKPVKLVEIHYLYYDMDEEYNPNIINEPEYNQQLRECTFPMKKLQV